MNHTVEIKNNCLHRLVEYIIKEYDTDKDGKPIVNEINEKIWTVRYEFTADNLRTKLYRWYHIKWKKPEIYEANNFCRILCKDQILTAGDSYGHWSVTPHNLEMAREAYYGKKYKVIENFWVLPLNLSTAANAAAAVGIFFLTLSQNRNTDNVNKLIDLVKEQDKSLMEVNSELKITMDSLYVIRQKNQSSKRTSQSNK